MLVVWLSGGLGTIFFKLAFLNGFSQEQKCLHCYAVDRSADRLPNWQCSFSHLHAHPHLTCFCFLPSV